MTLGTWVKFLVTSLVMLMAAFAITAFTFFKVFLSPSAAMPSVSQPMVAVNRPGVPTQYPAGPIGGEHD